jgi:hypothetical protein
MLFGSIIFVGLGIGFVTNPARFISIMVRTKTVIFIGGFVGILFFGFIGFFILKKLFDKSPGLIISNDGITDNSSGVSAGFIPWSDIKEIREVRVVNQKFINLVVKNPEVYIDRQSNAFKRWIAQKNYKLYGTAIGISANGLKYNYEELKVLIQKRFQEYKSKNSK